MNIYVMRHGMTVWNEKGITQGRSKNRLSKQGVETTQGVALELKNIPIDIIISSPLMRTVQTANIVNQFHKVKIVKDEDLVEINQGIFSGRKDDSLSQEEKILKSQRSKVAGMETYEECFNRVKNFVNGLKNKYRFQNILIVTHDVVATFIEDVIEEKKVDFHDINFVRNFKNSEVKKFII